MNKYFKKFGIMFVMALILSLGFCISAFADDTGIVGTNNLNGTAENSAKYGERVTAPEIGWKRYDDTDNNIIYSGNFQPIDYGSIRSFYNGNIYSITSGTVKFSFYGTKLRLYDHIHPNRNRNSKISFDGGVTFESCSAYGSDTGDGQRLYYEKTGLEKGVHNVIINIPADAQQVFTFDCFDIDEDGYLIPYDESITLDKSTMDLTKGDSADLTATTTPAEVGVTWAVSDPTVASIEVDPTNGKITKITALKEGTCTITATTADGNNLSASCVINVTKKDTTEPTTPPDDSDNKTGATLIINLTDGETKVFDVSASEAAKFKEWYNTKTEYENQITYEFDKTVNSTISVEEDVVHDQITSYEIRKY